MSRALNPQTRAHDVELLAIIAHDLPLTSPPPHMATRLGRHIEPGRVASLLL
jgi:hypothetical protein